MLVGIVENNNIKIVMISYKLFDSLHPIFANSGEEGAMLEAPKHLQGFIAYFLGRVFF